MVVEKSPANDFWEDYAKICSAHMMCPMSSIMKQKESLVLTCAVKLIRAYHCPLILEALSFDKTLTAICFFSDPPKVDRAKKIWEPNFYRDPPFLCQNNLSAACYAVECCLKMNQNLRILRLERLPLSIEHVKTLSEGLKCCSSLQEFSLAGCCIGDKAAELLFEDLKHMINIQWVNFSLCDLSVKSAVAISSLLKFQSLMRHTEVWQESLRYSKPVLEKSRGIVRISLNNNDSLGDRAIEALREALMDDLWLKALDFQKCNIGIDGATALLKILKTNCILEILDLRSNNISKEVQEQIDLQLSLNNGGKILKYEQLPLTAQMPFKRRVHPTGKAISSTKISISSHTTNKIFDKATILSRKDTLCRSRNKMQQVWNNKDETTKINSFEDHSEDLCEINKQLSTEVEKLKKSLFKERKKRKHVQDKLNEMKEKNELLQAQLGNERMTPVGFTLIDDSTYLNIQETFTKFSNFLKLVGEAGLQDLMPQSLNYALNNQVDDFGSEVLEDVKVPKNLGEMENSELIKTPTKNVSNKGLTSNSSDSQNIKQ